VKTEASVEEERFSMLKTEWVALRRRDDECLVEGWEASLRAMNAENERLRAAGSWQTGPADFLGVTRRSRHELTHSAMLGWLLDSAGRHGLGNRRVVALLSHVGLDVGADHHFVVRREVAGDTAVADLVLTSGELKVVIENKLDAIEQPWQCQRLADDHPEAQALIFLTLTGRAPATARPEDSWQSVRWSDIAKLLEEALRDSGPARGRHIAEDYLSTLRRELP
jgi:PD-(D/E)XK nuclease superfamily